MCIFCEIINGNIPGAKVYEDDEIKRAPAIASRRGCMFMLTAFLCKMPLFLYKQASVL